MVLRRNEGGTMGNVVYSGEPAHLLFTPAYLLFPPAQLLFPPVQLLFPPAHLLFPPAHLLFPPSAMPWMWLDLVGGNTDGQVGQQMGSWELDAKKCTPYGSQRDPLISRGTSPEVQSG